MMSEFLLQQTQVKQAIPYYTRFIKRFPTVQALARAHSDSVLKAWEGCGLYARARNLHKTAQVLMRQYRGRIPHEREKLLELPGIGPYLAASISSIAYEQPHAVLDANVLRVLARVQMLRTPIEKPDARKKLQHMAQEWMDEASANSILPSLHNQSMMELGALVCRPKNPHCQICPLKKACRAHLLGRTEDFPVHKKKKIRPTIHAATGILRNRKGEILVSQRYGDDFLGGLWEFPGGKQEEGERLEETVEREFREEVGLRVRAMKKIMQVRAEYTHKSVVLHVFEVKLVDKTSCVPHPIDCQNVKYMKFSQLGKLAFPKANRVILEQLKK